MRNQLKALGVVHDVADVASTRPLGGKTRAQKRDEAWLADRARELAEAGGQGELRVPRAPEEPSADERARHEVTHLPYQPWCGWCVMEKGRAQPHLQRPVESVKVPEFELDFCYLLEDLSGDITLVIKRGATTLVMVNVSAQNPLCAAVSTKTDENAYLSALCTAFVKRMACAKAVLKVVAETTLKLSADKIALRASTDGTQLKIETAPRFSSQSVAAGRTQDAVGGHIRC